MSSKDGEAKVFGDGDVTIAINQVSGSAKIYIGAQQIQYISEIKLVVDFKNPTQLELRFPTSNEPNVQLAIEENIRAAKALPWVRVVR